MLEIKARNIEFWANVTSDEYWALQLLYEFDIGY